MDVILEFCDDWFLDKTYAHVLPHPAKPSILSSFNATAASSSSPSSSSISASHNVTSSLSSSYLSLDPNTPATSLLPRDSMLRQCISLYAIALIGALILYYFFCSVSYYLFFDRRLEHHPRFLKNQISMEIKSSMIAAPWIDLLTLPWFLGEVRGHSKMYSNISDFGWTYLVGSVVGFLFFTDFCIYWVHRLEHHPRIYKYIHKPHHKWISEFFFSISHEHPNTRSCSYSRPVPTPWAALAFHPVDGYAQSLPYQ